MSPVKLTRGRPAGGQQLGKNVFLVHSPINRKYQDASQHHAPPLGLVCLKTYLERSIRADVSILDGSMMPAGAIIDRIRRERPDLVGQSVQQISYGPALEIATVAKEIGAISVFGGHHATQLSTEIVWNRHDIVDAVVQHDGEIPLAMICQGLPMQSIPNLAYWDSGVRSNPSPVWQLDIYPDADYSNFDLSPYVRRYSERLGFSQPRTFLRAYSHKGCGNRAGSAGCYFCGRADQGVRFKSPRRYVNELVELKECYGASSVFDVGDDIAFSIDWLRRVAALVETERLELDLGCFGRACRLVNPEVAVLLRRIGISNVIIGFESGDAEVLRGCGKGLVTPEDNLKAASNLFQNGIDVCASYVIGLPGESEGSLARTLKNAGLVLEMAEKHLGHKPYELVGNLFEPSPGSPAFHHVKAKFPEKYEHADSLDLAEVQADYFRSHWSLRSQAEVDDFRRLLVTWAGRINGLTVESDFQGFLAEEAQTKGFAPVNEAAGNIN